ncbi:hypothetical protein D9M71_365260 [compost metagenome]
MAVEALADALHQQAHGLAGDGGETLHAQDAVPGHGVLQHGQQARFLGFGEDHVEGVELVVVVVLVFLVVVGAAGVDVQLGLAVQAEQHLQRQLAALRLDDLDRRRQFLGHLGAHGGQGLGVEQVGLVQQHQVGAGQLVGEQLVQRRFVVQVRVLLALGIDLLGEGGEGTGGHGRAVDHRDHRVHRAGGADFRPVEGLHQRLRQGQAGGFDEDVVELAATFDQLAHHREELFLHGAAQAAVGQLVDAAVGFFLAAADGTLLEDGAVDAQFAEFVDDHRDAAAAGVGQQVAEQGGFAGAEEAGDDGDGKFGEGFHGGPGASVSLTDGQGQAGCERTQARHHRITPPGQLLWFPRQVSWLTVCAGARSRPCENVASEG